MMTDITSELSGVPESDLVIEVHDLCKSYGKTVIHKNLQFDVRRGEVVAIVGGSGRISAASMRQPRS